MARPNLTAASFPKLHGYGTDSNGTVSGSGIAQGYPVNVKSKNGNKTWAGQVGGSAGSGVWNATVRRIMRDDEKQEGLETVSVTVTNNSGETSNTIETESDVVP